MKQKPSFSSFLERPLASRTPAHALQTAYMARIQVWRKILPVIAGGLVILILVWPQVKKTLEESAEEESPVSLKDHIQGRNRLGGARFQSIDAKGRPYYLQAKSAVQKSAHTADLEIPQSKIDMKDGESLEIQSQQGFYNDQSKILEYNDQVVLRSPGYFLTTSFAQVHLEEKRADGNKAIAGESPSGKIWAEGFDVAEEGVIHFKGKSRLIIDPAQQASPRQK